MLTPKELKSHNPRESPSEKPNREIAPRELKKHNSEFDMLYHTNSEEVKVIIQSKVFLQKPNRELTPKELKSHNPGRSPGNKKQTKNNAEGVEIKANSA
jgi:hypothetical protein